MAATHVMREALMSGTGFRPGGIMKGAALGGAAAGVLNVILYLAGSAAGAEYFMMQPGAAYGMVRPIPIAMPFILSLVPGLLGGGVLIGLTKVVPDKAWKVFLGLCAVAFLVMLAGCPPRQTNMAAIVSLELMHVVAVAGAIVGIHKFGRS